MNLYHILDLSADKWASRLAIHCDKEAYTYKALKELVIELAREIQQKGVKRGAKVAIIIENPLEFVLVLFSLSYCACIPIPVYSKTGEKKINDIVEKYDINYLFTSFNIAMDKTNRVQYDIKYGAYKLKLFCNKVLTIDKSLSETELILLSSGTTSIPKAIMLSENNVFANICSISSYLNLSRHDNILVIKNMNHASSIVGEMLVGIYNGCTLYMTKDIPLIGNILKMIMKCKISVFFAVPTILKGMLEYKRLGEYNLETLRIINFYGAKMPQEDILLLCSRFQWCNIIYSYGLTEASPRVTYIEKKDLLDRLGSCGKAIENVKVQVINEFGELLPANKRGEIIVSGPNVMQGYYRDTELTNRVIKNNILYTKDIGYMDSDGYLYVCGRKDNMLVSAGKNIYPEEIEEVMVAVPGILEAFVVGNPQKDGTVVLVAYVVLKEDTVLDKKEIYRHCMKNLENYKIPKNIIIVEKFAKTVSGKIKREQAFIHK